MTRRIEAVALAFALALALAPTALANSCFVYAGFFACEHSDAPLGAPHAARAGTSTMGAPKVLWVPVPYALHAEASAGTEWPSGDARAAVVLFAGARGLGPLLVADVTCPDLNGDGVPDRCHARTPMAPLLP